MCNINECSEQKNRYQILTDNISTLNVLDTLTKEVAALKPEKILFSGLYLLYSKRDILRIGYICGQNAKIKSRLP